MASGRVRTGIRPGTDRHLSIPRSGRSGFGDIRSIPRLPHRSVPKSSRSMSVLDHGQTGRVGPAWAKYPRNLGRVREPVRTDRDFIMWMSHMGL